mgnify:CR=1 FL=1
MRKIRVALSWVVAILVLSTMPTVAAELGEKALDFESPSTKDGVLNPQSKLAQRSYFIVDKRGIVRYKKVQERGAGLVSNAPLVEEIRKINQAN